MRVLFTGQTGIDKKSHLHAIRDLCAGRGKSIDAVFSIGDLMYDESQQAGRALKEGRILDLPLAELAILRRSAFNRISKESSDMQTVFVGSHAVFRWNNQLFRAFELTDFEIFKPDVIVTLLDDVEAVKSNLDELNVSGQLPENTTYSMRDLMIWREEEILASEILASTLKIPHYVLGTRLDPAVSSSPLEVVFNLIFEPWKKRAYVSYPISDAQTKPAVWEKVLQFRKLARSYLSAFDPLMISEKRLHNMMLESRQTNPQATGLVCDVGEMSVSLNLQDIESISQDIDGQIVARDYKLIDQSEMIVAYVPLNTDGSPMIAGGVQSEIEHAYAATKQILVLWEASKDPTPFIGQKADKRFSSIDELEDYLKKISQRPGQLEMPIESK